MTEGADGQFTLTNVENGEHIQLTELTSHDDTQLEGIPDHEGNLENTTN